MSEHVETLIVGAGQAGLATSYCLTQSKREHVILEQAAEPASAWRNQRWDSFTLVTPNGMTQLPGADFSRGDPDGFMPRAEIVACFDRYVADFKPPLRCNTLVTAVESEGGRYLVRTDSGTMLADNVIIATGVYQHPKIPPFHTGLPTEIQQLHSSAYRSPGALPPGAVLVVGSGQSGAQIAEELRQHGRKVYLSVGSAGRVPRRYRGKDINWWQAWSGYFDLPYDQLPPPKSRHFVPPHLSGRDGGHTLNLHQFARDGVVLLGHVQGVNDGRIRLAPDLKESLAKADGFEAELLKRIDAAIARREVQAPVEEVPHLQDGYAAEIIAELDLKAAGVGSVIWAGGYDFSFDLVKLRVFDAFGLPAQDRGVTAYPGLYFVGLPWQPGLKSAFLFGAGETAQHVAAHIAERR